MRILLWCVALISAWNTVNAQSSLVSGNQDLLKLTQIKPNIYVHETYLQTETWGKVGCNGMIFINGNKAIVFDTPTDSASTEELFKAFDKSGIKVVGIVINHFHNDCLGGLKQFHNRKIKSYASNKTIALAKRDQIEVPQIGFEKESKIKLSNKTVINFQPGAAHTHDNIVSYVPSEKTLFGGCMVKEIDAGRGYLGDAMVKDWPNTIKTVRNKFPDAQHIVPGHGESGGQELLDYTIRLFSK